MDGPCVLNPVPGSFAGTRLLSSRRVLVTAMLAIAATTNPRATAQEPVIPFIEGLRERGYFDTALEYIDGLTQRNDLPADVREVLDLQRGLTLQQRGSASRVPEDRDQYVSQAETSLKKFVSERGQHPQAALANSMLGELLFERARSLIWKTDDTESADRKLELQQQARSLIDEAQGIYQTAKDQYQKLFEVFPKFIEQSKDEEQFQLRLEAEARYLRAWFNLVRCTYERGQTFDKGTEERKKTLITAAEMFEEIHTSRRTNQIGLHARLMMGKCFQEQDDVGRALGIYNEILGHKSDNVAVAVLRGIAQHYRLICLNDPQKNDHQLVVQEATDWLQNNRQLATSQSGLGILWEKAIAEEKLAEVREISESDKQTALSAAANAATQVAKYPGPYREPANAMSRRLRLLLGEKNREPKNFADAFERARGMIAQIQQLRDELAKATDSAERSAKKSSLDNHLIEVGRLLQLALDLRNEDSDPKAVAQARYLLSFVMYQQGKALDAVILSSYCMANDRKDDPDTALNATEIAMAAAVAAWNQAPARDRDFETRLLRDVCQKILELYPQSSRGGEARMRLGSVYRTMNQPLEGAKWYLEVPETDPQYASARINAGQSYWAAWTQTAAVAADDPETPASSAEEMQAWKTEARKLLTQGIQMTRDKLGATSAPTEELVAAEVSLASILNLDGEFTTTIERLTSGAENSIATAVEVPEGTVRPEEGTRSKSFAGLTYRLLLRAYVGTQQIDLALQTMTRLEKVGGKDILAAYTQLGIELQEELKRLNVSGEKERLAQVRDSFEKFLAKVYESRDKSDYHSLLWIGETYFGLGQGVSGDAAAADGYYGKAGDAYSEILNGSLVPEENRNAVQLRLARCRRQQKRFDEAFKISEEILAKTPMALEAQFEAAQTLSDWGANTEPPKLLAAIQGVKDSGGKQNVWGWAMLSKRLQQITTKNPSPDLRARYLDARFELSNSRRRYAGVSKQDSDKQLKAAMGEIASFLQVFRDLDDVSFARFDRLYQDIQSDLGQTPVPLERAAAIAPLPEPVPTVVEDQPKDNPAASPGATAAVATVPDENDSGWLLPVLVTGLCIGLAAGVVIFVRKQQKKPKPKARVAGGSAIPTFADMNIGLDQPAGTARPDGMNFITPAAMDFGAFGAVGNTAHKATALSARPVASNRATAAPAGKTTGMESRPKTVAPVAPKERTVRPLPAVGSETTEPGSDAAPAGTPRPRPRPAGSEGTPPSARPTGSSPAATRSTPVEGRPAVTRPPGANPADKNQPPTRPQTPKPETGPPPQKRPKPPSDK